MNTIMVWTAVFVTVAFKSLLNAGVVPLGGEHAMVSQVTGHQSRPSVALRSGGGLVAWENSSPTGTKRIAVQPLGEDGRALGSVQVVSQNVDQVNDVEPVIVAVDAQTAVVVWVSGPRGNTDVYMALVSSAGARLGEVQRVNQTLSRNQGSPGVGVSADGVIGVVWQSEGQDGDGQGVYGRIYSSGGTALGGEVLLSQTTAGNQSDPGVVGLDGNRFLVTWVSGVVNGRNAVGGLKLRSNVMGRFFRGSSAQRNEFRISDPDVIVQSPAAHLGGDGAVHVGWMQRTEINSQDKFDIWGVSLNPETGMPGGAARKVNDFSSGQQLNPKIVSQGGEVVYVWESVGQDLGGHGIVGKSYPNGQEFVINSQRNLDQYDPAVAVDAQGRVVVAWANTIRADYSVISSQHFMVGNGPVPAALQVAAAALESVSATPAAPSVVTPAAAPEPPTMVGPVNPPRASAPVVAAPSFPQPASAASVAAAVAANTSRSLPPGLRRPPAATASSSGTRPAPASVFSMNRFPSRASLGAPGQAAASALQQMANLRSSAGARSGGFSARGGHSNRAASLSRGAMMNPARAQSSASRFGQQPGVRSGGFPNRGALASRNSGGIGAVRGLSATLASRNGPQGGLRSGGTAQSRFDQMRQNAQRAGQAASLGAQRQVPAGLQLNGENMSINWSARAGARYQVQGSNDQVSWNNHGGVRTGRSGSNSAAIDRSFRYYRIVESK